MIVPLALAVRALPVVLVALEVQRFRVERRSRVAVPFLVVSVRVVRLVRGLDHDDHGSVLALAAYNRVSSVLTVVGHAPGFPCRPRGPRAPAAPTKSAKCASGQRRGFPSLERAADRAFGKVKRLTILAVRSVLAICACRAHSPCSSQRENFHNSVEWAHRSLHPCHSVRRYRCNLSSRYSQLLRPFRLSRPHHSWGALRRRSIH